jgi:hypothetical protein
MGKFFILYLILSLWTVISCKEERNIKNLKFLDGVEPIFASVNWDSKTQSYSILQNIYDNTTVAYGTYKKDMENSGWDSLTISSYQGEDNKYEDEVKSYAMGFLEGSITYERIWNHYQNCNAFFNFPSLKMPDNTREYLKQNRLWIYAMYQQNGAKDAYWNQAYNIFRQFEGLIDAYNLKVTNEKKISVEEAMIMNSHDISELAYWNKTETRPQFHLWTASKISDYVDEHTHCSALIKVAADYSDIWFGHNTWTSFASMTRFFKEYRFKSNLKQEKSKTIAFSSYPGAVNSIDDFYITSSDLFVTETTNSIFNTKLYDMLNPESLLTWLRVMIANRLASSGSEWVQIFADNNSGTYNNQFQVLDLKLIDPDQKSIEESNVLWIIEQIPGYTESADVTKILKYGYWPGYNSAYFKEIRQAAGYDDILEKHPELRESLDYDSCARAKIFRRDQANVVDIDSYKYLMRYNNFKNDPFSNNNPTLAIASRKDLFDAQPDCRGATDAKLASIRDIKGKQVKKINIISGPTTENQIPFNTINSQCISANRGKYVFNGLPAEYTFDWIQYETSLFVDY